MDLFAFIGALARFENDGHRPFTYEQLAALVKNQRAMLDQFSPFGHQPAIGTLPQQRSDNLRTPMQARPTQKAYDITRDAAKNFA